MSQIKDQVYESPGYDKLGNILRLQRQGTPVYHYFLKDHLGNVRVVMNQGGETVEQSTSYYPFGGIFAGTGDGEQPIKFGGKEFDPMHGLNWSDFVARMKGNWRFMSIDPLCEKYYSVSPYAYCSNNPINRIDLDGRADFWLNRKIIGNDGVDDHRVLVIKTIERTFENNVDKVDGAGLSKKEQKSTIDFIKTNSGNVEAFRNNEIAYSNSIAIEGSAETRQSMVNVVSADNGKGGTLDANNREYGGSIESGAVIVANPGEIANPTSQSSANIVLPTEVSTFHSHPSGTVVTSPPAGTIGGTKTTSSFNQFPSSIDVGVAGGNTHYVFGRANNKVYVYTSKGVQAVIPFKHFVNPKR